MIGLLGRNGAGKSTLIECLLGLAPVTSGTVQLFGEPLAQLSEASRANIGYVPQNAAAFDWLTAPQMLALVKSFYPRWNDAKVDGLLSRWSVPTDKPIGRLSGGEQQRLAIIRALAHEPRLLVLDEPAASLDPAGRRDFLREIIDMCDRHASTVLFSTHILTDLERIALDVALLQDGRIVLQAPLDLVSEQAHRLIGDASARQLLITRHGLAVKSAKDGQSAVALLDEAALISAQQLGVQATHLSLEDYFIEVTQP